MVPSGCTAGPATLDQAAECVPVSGWYRIWGMGSSWSLSPSPFCSGLSLILFPGIPQPRAVSHRRSFSGLGHSPCQSAPRGWGQQSPPTRARPSALGATLHLPPSLLPPSLSLFLLFLSSFLSLFYKHIFPVFSIQQFCSYRPPPPRAGPSTPCGLLLPYNTLNTVFWDRVGINVNVIFNPKSAPFSF